MKRFQVNESNERYKRASNRKKAAPVKRVTVSAEAQRTYEELMKERDEQQRVYGRFLGSDNKVR
jgi:hypothetical protein